MKYKCLVLDHDDTVVRSTPTIHYPAFVESMKALRPDLDSITLEEFLSYCFEPGFSSLCEDILAFDEKELETQTQIWRSYTAEKIPPLYDGFESLIKEFKEAGGYICVVSHSEKDRIIRDYKKLMDIEPDMVFGWEKDAKLRKPHPYPLFEIMKEYNLKAEDLIMVDDLKPGLDMAKSASVDFACAGWSHFIDSAKEYMLKEADYYFTEVDQLRELVLG